MSLSYISMDQIKRDGDNISLIIIKLSFHLTSYELNQNFHVVTRFRFPCCSHTPKRHAIIPYIHCGNIRERFRHNLCEQIICNSIFFVQNQRVVQIRTSSIWRLIIFVPSHIHDPYRYMLLPCFSNVLTSFLLFFPESFCSFIVKATFFHGNFN